MNEYLDSGDEQISQSHFLRMLALGCLDMFVTLPLNATSLISNILNQLPFVFFEGWTFIHTNWEPLLLPKSLWSTDRWSVVSVHWNEWISFFWAVVFFALFGLTPKAKNGYRRLFRLLGKPFRASKRAGKEEDLPEAVFKSGRETGATNTSNVSSRYALATIFALTRSKKSYSNAQPEVLA